ncbi:putative RDD family membrane protein YckC [Asanoa ferruginea]|uniref:Putative RDD family membrane protein YckC n=1 Tax=Asanoa ferruginea TaxID=53367 RepID=A0A3D9ZII0_9ACTN|nr:RDD family protein [Asanoa ferruginea]REF96649.1 putative RDD family membrane protein YckC [Asanoa ferruginea]GIF48967.1 RDD family protein [Asanoa ferruginea]
MQQGPAGPPWTPPPAPIGPSGDPLATFGDRFLAYLIDGLIVGLVTLVLTCPIFFFAFFLPLMNAENYDNGEFSAFPFLAFFLAYAAVFALQIIITYLYFVEYQLRSGQTVGKRVMSLRVLPIQPGRPLDRGILVRRYLVQFVAAIFVPFLNILDGLWQLWDKPFQQTLHDKAAETVVAKVVQ